MGLWEGRAEWIPGASRLRRGSEGCVSSFGGVMMGSGHGFWFECPVSNSVS